MESPFLSVSDAITSLLRKVKKKDPACQSFYAKTALLETHPYTKAVSMRHKCHFSQARNLFRPNTRADSVIHKSRCSQERELPQRGAMPDAVCCDGQRSTLRGQMQHAAFLGADGCTDGFCAFVRECRGSSSARKTAFRNPTHPSCRQKALLLQKTSELMPWCKQYHPGNMPSA